MAEVVLKRVGKVWDGLIVGNLITALIGPHWGFPSYFS
jgi:hypothetical protein